MKGVVFTEYLEFVESKFGLDTVDGMIEKANPSSGGSYAATGTYSHKEIVSLVTALSALTGVRIGELLQAYGEHLFGRLAAMYKAFTADCQDTFSFLHTIDNHIHVEVRKIYPDAELPRFTCQQSADGRTLTMEYRSPRRFDDLAEGLIRGAARHYGEAVEIKRIPLPDDGSGCVFVLARQGAA